MLMEWIATLGSTIESTQQQMDRIIMEYTNEIRVAGMKAFSTKLGKQPNVINMTIVNQNDAQQPPLS